MGLKTGSFNPKLHVNLVNSLDPDQTLCSTTSDLHVYRSALFANVPVQFLQVSLSICHSDITVTRISIYPFTRHSSFYVQVVNKIPSFCAMAIECDIFSFELHSNMLSLHRNGNVFN